MQRTKTLLGLILSASVSTGALAASSDDQKVDTATDGEWLSISGTVMDVTGDRFSLDYGRDTITVEVDDYDWDYDNLVIKGDTVTVTGRMDDDFFERRSIEASSVYLEKLNEMFFASAMDEEDGYYTFLIPTAPNAGDWMAIAGVVESTTGPLLTLDTGLHSFTVDTGLVEGAPLSEGGERQIKAGDRVVVSGILDDLDLFDGRQIEATSITRMSRGG